MVLLRDVQRNVIFVHLAPARMMANVPMDGDHTYAIVAMDGLVKIVPDLRGEYLGLIEAHSWNSVKTYRLSNCLGKPPFLSKRERQIVPFYR